MSSRRQLNLGFILLGLVPVFFLIAFALVGPCHSPYQSEGQSIFVLGLLAGVGGTFSLVSGGVSRAREKQAERKKEL